MKITNVSVGPRGFNSVSGPMLLDPGQSVDAEIFQREKEHIVASQWFEVKGNYSPNPGSAAATIAQAAPSANDELEELKKQLAERDAELAKLKAESLDREEIKKQADELGVDYAKNIPTDKLKDLIDAKLSS